MYSTTHTRQRKMWLKFMVRPRLLSIDIHVHGPPLLTTKVGSLCHSLWEFDVFLLCCVALVLDVMACSFVGMEGSAYFNCTLFMNVL